MADYSFLIVFVFVLVTFVLLCRLVLAFIRWLNRH